MRLRASGTFSDDSCSVTRSSVTAHRCHWQCVATPATAQTLCYRLCVCENWLSVLNCVCFPSTTTCCFVLAFRCLWRLCGWVCSCGDVQMSWMSVEACCVCHCICDFDSHPGAVVTCCLLLSVLSTSRNSAEIRRSMCLCCWWLSLVLRLCSPYRLDCPLLTAETRKAIYQLEWLRFYLIASHCLKMLLRDNKRQEWSLKHHNSLYSVDSVTVRPYPQTQHSCMPHR